MHGLFPIRLRHIFQNTSQVLFHNLRGFDINLFIPDRFLKRSFQYRGATLGNSLPVQARNQAILTSLRAFLLAQLFFTFIILVNIV